MNANEKQEMQEIQSRIDEESEGAKICARFAKIAGMMGGEEISSSRLKGDILYVGFESTHAFKYFVHARVREDGAIMHVECFAEGAGVVAQAEGVDGLHLWNRLACAAAGSLPWPGSITAPEPSGVKSGRPGAEPGDLVLDHERW
jgi:hypothetical protein